MSPQPLATAADFQTTWYLTLLVIVIATLTGWGLFQVYRALREMWRADDRLMVLTMVSLVTITLLLFGAMLALVVVGVGRNALSGPA